MDREGGRTVPLPGGRTGTVVLEGGPGTETSGVLPEQTGQRTEGGQMGCHQNERYLWTAGLPVLTIDGRPAGPREGRTVRPAADRSA